MITNVEDWTRVELGTWPTPLERAPHLALALGLGEDDLWMKRDDLTGLGAGGNKVRKLEWLAGTALAQDATTLCSDRDRVHRRVHASELTPRHSATLG
jgi:1-aminocyclopropane-1-carboxylate deaminase/D-cysteine desulfhydrase-like pyridoxal-dependent ACC family enzyme